MEGLNKNLDGWFGEFGGAFIPELLYSSIRDLQNQYLDVMSLGTFKDELAGLLSTYVGRPTPLTFAKNLSEKYGFNVFLKREDLCHTGSHKINNTLGQALIAKYLSKSKIVAETGAGQHGVATATVCALMKFECTVYMGAVDIERQSANVGRMKMLGAKVIPVFSGSQTLKDATNEAMRHWINNASDTYYLIGSVVGPHPYPKIVAHFQSIISSEIEEQFRLQTECDLPNMVIACVGGGSNAIGAFYHFLEGSFVSLLAVEAGGKGIHSGKSAATTYLGSSGVLHGSRTILMQNSDGQIIEPHSISAGLDYPGIGPQHAYLHATGRVKYVSATDNEAVEAGIELARLEGIIPALESAHALSQLPFLSEHGIKAKDNIVICLSGRGDKDMRVYSDYDLEVNSSPSDC